jgi:hypothetical protein
MTPATLDQLRHDAPCRERLPRQLGETSTVKAVSRCQVAARTVPEILVEWRGLEVANTAQIWTFRGLAFCSRKHVFRGTPHFDGNDHSLERPLRALCNSR